MIYTAQCKWSEEDTVEVRLYACDISIRCNEGDDFSTVCLDIEQVQELQTILTRWLRHVGDVSCCLY